MGSRRFCEDYCGDIDFAAVIVTDLVGHDATDGGLPVPGPVTLLLPHLKRLVGVMGTESDGTFPAIVEAAAKNAAELRVIPVLHRYVGPMSDHASFAEAGQPFLFLSCGMGTHYHTPQDTMDWINFDKLAHITRFIADIVVRIDHVPADAEHAAADPFDTDLRMLRKALGPVAIAGLRAVGIKMPESRKELDGFLGALVDGQMH
ncbi:M28 family peptidase [Luteolibacter sp. GHJ8]|uniref:M28 family peptidase n=1 Tax=Luteolibacter rhizosphaerae TaxID=2989719 RepID=A0ABT3FZU1_9BACT|nr:M28 family peptidase [Luteolibacter rhizosphaerae]MCW1913105.1 M28 family peptidase [Luteolibacter rhizosphaerae]